MLGTAAEPMNIHHAAGPDCPHCGCNATEIVDAGMRYGRAWARFKCDHCQRVSSTISAPSDQQDAGGVAYNPVNCRCPRCNAPNPRVHTTRGRIRFHRCDKCGSRFKSVEKSA